MEILPLVLVLIGRLKIEIGNHMLCEEQEQCEKYGRRNLRHWKFYPSHTQRNSVLFSVISEMTEKFQLH